MTTWIQFDKCRSNVGTQMRGAGADTVDFLRLQLRTNQGEAIGQVELSL